VPAGTEQRPAAAAAPGPPAVPGRQPLTLAGASAVTSGPAA